jgi:glycerol-3-phosphate dehydrogenase (NAD(P)+)
MKLSILGCGNWGSVFGIMQYKNGHAVKIWEYDECRAEQVIKSRDNKPFLTGYKIPEQIEIHWDLEKIVEGAETIIFAIPSQAIQDVVVKIKKIKHKSKYYLNLTKGIDIESLRRPSEIISQLSEPNNNTYVLSGPCIANEIIRGEPTAVVLVGSDSDGTRKLQHLFATKNFRIYQGDDIIGVELGAAIKNVIALGCGISDGLGFGSNAKGALITRGIVEIQRLGVKMGAKTKTFWGLSGLGDLVTTSFSEESRNHRFGVEIGRGKSVEEIKRKMVMVAEGVPTSKAIKRLAQKFRIDMPICEAVYEILFNNKSPTEAIKDLMTRSLKHE